MISSKNVNSLRYGELSPYGLNEGRHERISTQRTKKPENPTGCWDDKSDLLELNDPNPGGLLPIAGTQPDIVRSREADFDREMCPNSQPICVLPFKQAS